MTIPNKNTISLTRGFWCIFKDGVDTIAAGASAVNGKEYVYINGDLILEQRSYSTTSRHSFEFKNNRYEVEFCVPEVLKGKIECSLSKNSKLIQKYKTLYKYKFSFYEFSIYFALVFIYGFATIYYHLSAWSLIPFVAVMSIVSIVFAMRHIVFIEEDL